VGSPSKARTNRGPARRVGSPSKARTKRTIRGWTLCNRLLVRSAYIPNGCHMQRADPVRNRQSVAEQSLLPPWRDPLLFAKRLLRLPAAGTDPHARNWGAGGGSLLLPGLAQNVQCLRPLFPLEGSQGGTLSASFFPPSFLLTDGGALYYLKSNQIFD